MPRTIDRAAAQQEQREARTALVAATAKYNAALAAVEEARRKQRYAIFDALQANVKQVEVVGLTGFTREHIRRIDDEITREVEDTDGTAANAADDLAATDA